MFLKHTINYYRWSAQQPWITKVSTVYVPIAQITDTVVTKYKWLWYHPCYHTHAETDTVLPTTTITSGIARFMGALCRPLMLSPIMTCIFSASSLYNHHVLRRKLQRQTEMWQSQRSHKQNRDLKLHALLQMLILSCVLVILNLILWANIFWKDGRSPQRLWMWTLCIAQSIAMQPTIMTYQTTSKKCNKELQYIIREHVTNAGDFGHERGNSVFEKLGWQQSHRRQMVSVNVNTHDYGTASHWPIDWNLTKLSALK